MRRFAIAILSIAAVGLLGAALVWQALTSHGNPDPLQPGIGTHAAALNVAVLVFREGLECILVLSAITASMSGSTAVYRRPVAVGAAVGLAATIVTWLIAVSVVDDLAASIPMLELQAVTGILAAIVLIVVMNWFFHKVYWTGWISLHTQKKAALLRSAGDPSTSRNRLLLGLGLLGFSSLYREGVEVVLFLQSYRLKLGPIPVRNGVVLGSILTGAVAVLTFVLRRRLPYKRMLVLTGVLLTVVLTVMVGEQAQELQLARWLSTTEISSIARWMPPWMGLWFAVFPTVETVGAQVMALVVVLASYAVASGRARRASSAAPFCRPQSEHLVESVPSRPPESNVTRARTVPARRAGQ